MVVESLSKAMKPIWFLPLAVLLLVLSITPASAQTAQARFYCLSLRVQQGSAGFGDTLDLTSLSFSSPPNGELLPAGGTYVSGIILDVFGFPINGTMDVSLPPFADANGNGFNDFFEVPQGTVTTFTSGSYSTGFSDGSIVAQWSRSAGSASGTVVFSLEDDTFGPLGDFDHTFELIEYTGPLNYTPGTSSVGGNVILTQTGNPTATLQGAVQFQKSLADPFNELTLQAGGWSNQSAQTLTFDQDDFFRDLILDTNYYGYVFFADGDPNTSDADYPLWQLSIDDTNDADNDTIPDFSDAPSGPRRPLLTLTRGTTNLWLTISGDVGKLHHVLTRTNLTTGTGWQTNLSLPLTNDPQTLSLPLPATPFRFWRALVP